MQSFKSLLSQIIDEVSQRLGVNKEQLGSVPVRDMSVDVGADVGTELQEKLAKIIKPQIIQGLDVYATNPPSMKVNITPGYGSSQGMAHEIKTTQQVAVPNLNSVYYILLNGARVSVSTTYGSGLALAKIVIPATGTTNKILDDKNPESDYDGYVVSGKDLLFNNDFVIDDESIAQLKNTMSKIFAEYIFGTIKLNESLQIANEQGTLKADSDSVNFYDINGNELASYGAHEARIGNIKVTPSTIQSRDFSEGAHGFRLKDNGDAEFDNITARGTIHASAGTIDGDLTVGGSLSSPNFASGYAGKGWKIDGDGSATFENGIFRGELHTSVFVKDEIHATNGDFLVTNASVLASGTLAADTTIYTKDTVFSTNDIVRLKNETNSEYMRITGATSNVYTVARNLDSTGANDWQEGEAIVSLQSRVSLVASGDTAANLPYIDVIKRNSVTYNDETTKVRLGNLAGITDSMFGGALTGYGLYGQNVYLSGTLTSSLIQTTNTASRGIKIDTSNGFRAWDSSGNQRIQLNTDGSGWLGGSTAFYWDNAGNVNIGNSVTIGSDYTNRMFTDSTTKTNMEAWRHASDVTLIDGGDIYTSSITAAKISVTSLSALSADLGTITAGTVTGATLRTAASGARFNMDTSALVAYDDAAGEVFRVNVAGANVGDVIIGNSTNYMKFDKSSGDLTLISDDLELRTGFFNMLLFHNDTGITWFDSDNDEAGTIRSNSSVQQLNVHAIVNLSLTTGTGIIYLNPGNNNYTDVVTDLQVRGFSTLGTGNTGIKVKVLTGTMAATEGGTTSIAHGLTGVKMIMVNARANYTTNAGVQQNYTNAAGYEFSVYWDATNVNVVNHATNSENVLGTGLVVTIIYIE